MSDSVWPHRWQPTRLPRPWDSPGKNTGAISFSNAWKWKGKVKLLSRVRLFATPWTAAYQAPLSMGFSRQESWSGVPLPSPLTMLFVGFSGGSVGKESACNAGDLGLISGSGRSPGEWNGTPLKYSCLKNPMDRGAWWATIQRVTKNQPRLRN